MTLLVLDIHVLVSGVGEAFIGNDRTLLLALIALWPRLLAYSLCKMCRSPVGRDFALANAGSFILNKNETVMIGPKVFSLDLPIMGLQRRNDDENLWKAARSLRNSPGLDSRGC